MPIVRRTRLFKTSCGVLLVVLAVVVWSWDVNGVHTVKVVEFSLHKNLAAVQTSEKRSHWIPVVDGRLTSSCNSTHLFLRPSSGQRHCPRKRGICPRRDPWRGCDDFDSEWCARAPSIRAGLPGLCSPPVTTGRWSPRESTPVRHRQAVANWVSTVYVILTEVWTDCCDALQDEEQHPSANRRMCVCS